MLRQRILISTLLVWPGVWGTPASAQLYTGVDVTLSSRYVWRGLTRVNHWVMQPEMYLGMRVAGGFVSTGVWANDELHQAQTGDLSDLGPGASGWGEFSYWADYTRGLGIVDASVAFLRYSYRGKLSGVGRTSAANTSEVYGSIRLSSKYLAPKLALYFDVDRVRGAYIEGSGTIPVLGNPLGAPFWALYVQGLVGYSLGQEVNPARSSEGANFANDGFTHLDLSLSGNVTPILAGAPTTVHLEGHLQFNRDDLTRRTNATGGNASAKTWLAVSMRWEHAW